LIQVCFVIGHWFFSLFITTHFYAAERFALPALGRAAGRRPIGKMLRRGKMLGIAPESPASGARFVRLRFILPDSWIVKDLPQKNNKIIVRNYDFGDNPKAQTRKRRSKNVYMT
jgi:hypothetical protein